MCGFGNAHPIAIISLNTSFRALEENKHSVLAAREPAQARLNSGRSGRSE